MGDDSREDGESSGESDYGHPSDPQLNGDERGGSGESDTDSVKTHEVLTPGSPRSESSSSSSDSDSESSSSEEDKEDSD